MRTTRGISYNLPPGAGALTSDGAFPEMSNDEEGKILTSRGLGREPAFLPPAIGLAADIQGGVNGDLLMQSAADTTTFLAKGTAGQVLTAGVTTPVYINQSQLSAGTTINLAGAVAQSIPYQAGPGSTFYTNAGSANKILTHNGTSPLFAPNFTLSGGNDLIVLTAASGTNPLRLVGANAGDNVGIRYVTSNGVSTEAFLYREATTSSMIILNNGQSSKFKTTGEVQLPTSFYGSSTYLSTDVGGNIVKNSGAINLATNLAGGGIGAIPYQSATNSTLFLTPGAPGTVLSSTGVGLTYTNTVGQATSLAGGVIGAIAYQTAVNTTGFLTPGASGTVLSSTGVGLAYTDTVGKATSLAGGVIGAIAYQTAVNTTGFLTPGASGTVLSSTGGGLAYTDTIGKATSLVGGDVGKLVVQTAVNTTGFVDQGADGDILSVINNNLYWYNPLTFTVGWAKQLSIPFSVPGIIYQTSLPIPGSPMLTNSLPFGPIYGAVLTSKISAIEFTNPIDLVVGKATNLAGGSGGTIAYQTAFNATGFLPIGAANFLIKSTGLVPQYVDPDDIVIGKAKNIQGGSVGSVPIQTATGSEFLAVGGLNYLIGSNGTKPTYFNPANITVGNATRLTSIVPGVLYNTPAGSVSVIDVAVASGSILTATGPGLPPIWVSALLTTVGFAGLAATATLAFTANNAFNISSGVRGDVPYQDTAGTTAFMQGTQGQVIVHNGDIPVFSSKINLIAPDSARQIVLENISAAGDYETGIVMYHNTTVPANYSKFHIYKPNNTTGNGTIRMESTSNSHDTIFYKNGDVGLPVGPYASAKILATDVNGKIIKSSTLSLVGGNDLIVLTASSGTNPLRLAGSAINEDVGIRYVTSNGTSTEGFLYKEGPSGSMILLINGQASKFKTTGEVQLPVGFYGSSTYLSTDASGNIVKNTGAIGASASNLTGTVVGSVPYQSGSGVTSYTNAAAGFMVSNGTIPSFTSSPTIGAGTKVLKLLPNSTANSQIYLNHNYQTGIQTDTAEIVFENLFFVNGKSTIYQDETDLVLKNDISTNGVKELRFKGTGVIQTPAANYGSASFLSTDVNGNIIKNTGAANRVLTHNGTVASFTPNITLTGGNDQIVLTAAGGTNPLKLVGTNVNDNVGIRYVTSNGTSTEGFLYKEASSGSMIILSNGQASKFKTTGEVQLPIGFYASSTYLSTDASGNIVKNTGAIGASASNLTGTVVGSVPYQSGSGVTSYTNAAAGFMVSNGTIPSFTSSPTIGAGTKVLKLLPTSTANSQIYLNHFYETGGTTDTAEIVFENLFYTNGKSTIYQDETDLVLKNDINANGVKELRFKGTGVIQTPAANYGSASFLSTDVDGNIIKNTGAVNQVLTHNGTVASFTPNITLTGGNDQIVLTAAAGTNPLKLAGANVNDDVGIRYVTSNGASTEGFLYKEASSGSMILLSDGKPTKFKTTGEVQLPTSYYGSASFLSTDVNGNIIKNTGAANRVLTHNGTVASFTPNITLTGGNDQIVLTAASGTNPLKLVGTNVNDNVGIRYVTSNGTSTEGFLYKEASSGSMIMLSAGKPTKFKTTGEVQLPTTWYANQTSLATDANGNITGGSINYSLYTQTSTSGIPNNTNTLVNNMALLQGDGNVFLLQNANEGVFQNNESRVLYATVTYSGHRQSNGFGKTALWIEHASLGINVASTEASGTSYMSISATVRLAPSQIIKFWAYQDSGVGLNMENVVITILIHK